MPQAVGFIGALISGGLAGFGAAGGFAAGTSALLGAAIGATIGIGLYGINLLLAPGQVNAGNTSGLSVADTGLRFDPTPNFTSSQASIPLVFGKTAINCQIAHKRLYGDNYKKGWFFLACGEAPLEIDRILINETDMADLVNYTSTAPVGDPGDKSFYLWQELGGKTTFTLNGSASLSWGATGREWAGPLNLGRSLLLPPLTYRTIAGPIVSVYGGGSLQVHWKFLNNQCDGYGWVRIRLENYYSPSEVYYSANDGNWVITGLSGEHSGVGYADDGWFYISMDSTVSVRGGHVDTATEASGYYEFTGLAAGTTWRPVVEYASPMPEEQHACVQWSLDHCVVEDTPTEEEFSCFGTAYAAVHLTWHEPLSSTPTFSAIVKGFGRETGQDEGNPALCAYYLLTDRDLPTSDARDILLDRVDPDQVDWESVQETVAFCDSLGYTFNRAFGAPMEKEAALKEIMVAGRFFIYSRGGRFTFRPDRHEALTYVIDENQEIVPGSLKVETAHLDTPTVLRASYYDAGLDYTVQTIQVEIASETTRHREDRLDLTGVTDQNQAYELARYALLARTRLLYTVTCEVRYATAASLDLGDLVQVETDHPIISGKTWRLMAIPAEKDGLIYTLEMVQHDPAIYTAEGEDGYLPYTPWYHLPIGNEYPATWPGGTAGPSAVINLSIDGVAYQPAPSTLTTIRISYEFLKDRADKIKVEYSLDIGQSWSVAGYSTANTYTFDVDLRWGLLMVRASAVYGTMTGETAMTQDYVEGLGGDDAGIGYAQTGWSPIGGVA